MAKTRPQKSITKAPTATGPEQPTPPPLPSTLPTPPDREALINALLDYGLKRWEGEREAQQEQRHIIQDAESGELAALSAGTLIEHLGFLRTIYAPRETVGRMLDEIIDTVNTHPVRINTPAGPQITTISGLGLPPEFLEKFIIDSAAFAAYALIVGSFAEMTFSLRRNFRHARAFAVVTMQGLLSACMMREGDIKSAQIDVRGLIKEMKGESAKEVDEQLRKLFGVVPHVYMGGARGRRPLWTKTELRRELRAALAELPPEQRKLEGLFAWKKEKHPFRAPKSAQALKQLLYDKGLRLRDLNNPVRKGS